jgi:hypothetical protein
VATTCASGMGMPLVVVALRTEMAVVLAPKLFRELGSREVGDRRLLTKCVARCEARAVAESRRCGSVWVAVWSRKPAVEEADALFVYLAAPDGDKQDRCGEESFHVRIESSLVRQSKSTRARVVFHTRQ